MPATNAVNLHASDQLVPAGVKLPVPALWPISGLEKDHMSRIGLRLVHIRRGVNDGIEVFEMAVAYRQSQRIIRPPAHHAQPPPDASQAVPNKAGEPFGARVLQVGKVVAEFLPHQRTPAFGRKIAIVGWVLSIEQRQQAYLLSLPMKLPRHFVGD